MKTSTISSMSVQNALRYAVRYAENQLIKAQKEATTGVYDDIGASIGAKTTRSVDLASELKRIQNLKDTNSIVTQRLDASQTALTTMSKSGQTILNSLVALSNNSDSKSISTTATTISAAFQQFTSAANTSLNGEYLFSGINTDVKPLNDYFEAGAPAKTAVDNALAGFLVAQVPPLANGRDMSATQVDDFINNTLKPMFMGAGWGTTWSKATDQNMTSRVDRNQVIETSTNTNSDGMRNMAFAMVISTTVLTLDLNTAARQAAAKQATAAAGLAITGVDNQRTQLGLSQQRVTAANESLSAQKDIIETHLNDLQGVDAYEASTRLANLGTLLKQSYTLTAQIQQLSLVNFLR